MASRDGPRKELIVDLEPGSTGHEGGQIFTRDTESAESSIRYRATSSEVTESIKLDSPDGFVEVEVRVLIYLAPLYQNNIPEKTAFVIAFQCVRRASYKSLIQLTIIIRIVRT